MVKVNRATIKVTIPKPIVSIKAVVGNAGNVKATTTRPRVAKPIVAKAGA